MKKIIVLLLSVVLLAVGCSSGSSGSQGSDASGADTDSGNEVIELDFNTWFPTSDPVVEVLEGWGDRVHEETDGQVVINWYHANSLGTADTMLQDVSGGVYDLAYISPILVDDSEMFPYTIANLSFAISDLKSGVNVMKKFVEKYKDPKENVKYLGLTGPDPYVLWSKEPVKTVDDLKGMKIRAVSAVHASAVQNWGASPVATPLADIYDSLQKGTLDGAVFSLVGGEAWKYYEVAPYITTIPVSTPVFIPVINNDVFDSLPDDIKTKFENDFGPALGDVFTEHYSTEWDKAIESFKENSKGDVIELSEEEMKPFQLGSEEIWEAWVEEANQKGFPGEDMMEDFISFLVEEGISLPFE